MPEAPTPTSVELEILQALDLPDAAVPMFLEHISNFCTKHGGPAKYQELLAMVARFERSMSDGKLP